MAAPHSCGDRLCCSCPGAVPGVQQTLEEMDFERGIWSAAVDGDLGRVKSFIQKAADPSQPDSAGYTALAGVANPFQEASASTCWASLCSCCLSTVCDISGREGDDADGGDAAPCSTGATAAGQLGGDCGTRALAIVLPLPQAWALSSALGLCSLQHYASRNGHYAVCQFLLESGAKCDAQTHGGATALHRASYCGHTEIARLLLSHGSDPRLVDDDGMTSLHKAAERGHENICSLLLQHSPALKAIRDRKARLPCDLLPGNSALRDLLAS